MVAAPALTRLRVPPSASAVLLAAAWRGERLDGVDAGALDAALQLARRNHVAGLLARAYSAELSEELARVEAGNAATRRNLAAVSRLLRGRGVVPVLVKFDANLDSEYSNFDVVCGSQGFATAVDALGDWAVSTSTHPLERDKLLMHPPEGPAAHLHRHLSWFGVTVITAERLREGAVEGPGGFLVPSAATALRSHVAHACFQNLGVELDELLTLRSLLQPSTVADAQAAAASEGWGRSFTAAVAAIGDAVRRLDAGLPVRLPLRLPLGVAAASGWEHALAQARGGHAGAALREAALRAPLLLAKRRRARLDSGGMPARGLLVGISGPDGVGKSSVAGAIVEQVAARHGSAVAIHPYGCIACRTLGRGRRPAIAVAPQRQSRLRAAFNTLHAGVDALEMAVRMRAARLRAETAADSLERRTGRPAFAVVVTDRSPLDGLVKHAHRSGALPLRWFARMAHRYDRLVCLDAPAGVLTARDADHDAAEVERRRGEFARWSRRLPVILLPVDGAQPDGLGAAIVDAVLGDTPR